jgi:hypothetical protein
MPERFAGMFASAYGWKEDRPAIVLHTPGEQTVEITDKVTALFRRILELTPEDGKEQVRKNAREHFRIQF